MSCHVPVRQSKNLTGSSISHADLWVICQSTTTTTYQSLDAPRGTLTKSDDRLGATQKCGALFFNTEMIIKRELWRVVTEWIINGSTLRELLITLTLPTTNPTFPSLRYELGYAVVNQRSDSWVIKAACIQLNYEILSYIGMVYKIYLQQDIVYEIGQYDYCAQAIYGCNFEFHLRY